MLPMCLALTLGSIQAVTIIQLYWIFTVELLRHFPSCLSYLAVVVIIVVCRVRQ